MFQFAASNLKFETDSTASEVRLTLNGMVTDDKGSLDKTTLNSALSPNSLVTRFSGAATTTSAISLSVF